jgi:hypothetical protein
MLHDPGLDRGALFLSQRLAQSGSIAFTCTFAKPSAKPSFVLVSSHRYAAWEGVSRRCLFLRSSSCHPTLDFLFATTPFTLQPWATRLFPFRLCFFVLETN